MRLIINAEPDDFILAIRAAKWLIEQPLSQRDAVLAYHNGDLSDSADFYVRRNRSSISVSKTRRA